MGVGFWKFMWKCSEDAFTVGLWNESGCHLWVGKNPSELRNTKVWTKGFGIDFKET